VSRLQKWERLALKGDFSAMPQPFRWEESARFAHFVNVAEVPGSFDRVCENAMRISDGARNTGTWQGSAYDLWLTLFYQHRLQRHIAMDDSYDPALDDLCETLRAQLVDLSQADANDILSNIVAASSRSGGRVRLAVIRLLTRNNRKIVSRVWRAW
jgi:hypothetical protein